MSKFFLEDFFNQLQEFKRYPKYQYETMLSGLARRASIKINMTFCWVR